MYINVDTIKEVGLEVNDIMTLQLIFQNKNSNMENAIAMSITDDLLELLESRLLVKYINGTKKQSQFEKIRLTNEGTKILKASQVEGASKGDCDMADYLSDIYLDHEDKERSVGNRKKIAQYCCIFRNETQLSLHQMYWVCWLFLQEHKYTKVLEYIFFKGNDHRYSKFEDHLADSPLYKFFLDNPKDIANIWKLRLKKEIE
jgi:hypothetical protein